MLGSQEGCDQYESSSSFIHIQFLSWDSMSDFVNFTSIESKNEITESNCVP